MRKTVTLSESRLAASKNAPVGSSAKWRGCWPRVGSWPIGRSRPLPGAIAKIARLSWPRFEPYRNLPSDETAISAVPFFAENPAGSVDSVWSSRSAPASGSYQKAVIVEFSSLMT